MMAKKKDTTSGWLPCGCHIDSGRIVFCQWHGKVQQMAGLLDALRKYFLGTTGEESPFGKRIDELIPRRD
jgi:hypothetical protein